MIIHGDCIEEMRKMADNSISAIVTDPPYGLHFMGKDWDSFKFKSNKGKGTNWGLKEGEKRNVNCSDSDGSYLAGTYDPKRDDEFQSFIREVAIEALRIVKPGGHILMFGSPRRHHRQMAGLEDAGWEIRDCLMWIFGSGFPKSHNHFGIEGYGTALKPAYEPIILAMRPLDGTFAQNAEKWGQAGINIDGCRVSTADKLGGGGLVGRTSEQDGWDRPWKHDETAKARAAKRCAIQVQKSESLGRWPANVIFDEESGALLDEMSGHLIGAGNKKLRKAGDGNDSDSVFGAEGGAPTCLYDRGGGASRFFYCAKASSRERNEGLEGLEKNITGSFEGNVDELGSRKIGRSPDTPNIKSANNHPTVKPLKLMEYLIKLVMPPKDGILLDPFAGSGTTILAAKRLGFNAIGIEKQAEYCEIARARIDNFTSEKIAQEIQQLFDFEEDEAINGQ